MTKVWADVARRLSPGYLRALMRDDLPTGYRFTDQVDVFADIARDASTAAYLSDQGLWDAAGISPTEADKQGAYLTALLTRIEQFEVSPDADANPNQERIKIVNELLGHRNWLVKFARPFRTPDSASDAIQNELQLLRNARAETERVREEAKTALESIRTRAADTGAVSAATLYKDRATAEDKDATTALWGVGVAMSVFVVSALVMFVWLAPDPEAKTGATISAVAGRALALATVAYGITFFAKNFRAHRHLAAVNRFKANALEATPLLREGIATDDQRDVIVAELVRAVFAVPETGFVDANGESVTIQTPVHALLSGVGRSSSTP